MLCGSHVGNISLKKQSLLLEEVQKLNRENADKSGHQAEVSPIDQQPAASVSNLVDYLREDFQESSSQEKDRLLDAITQEEVREKEPEEKAAVTEKETKPSVEDAVKNDVEEKLKVPEETQEEKESAAEGVSEFPEVPAPREVEKEQTVTRYYYFLVSICKRVVMISHSEISVWWTWWFIVFDASSTNMNIIGTTHQTKNYYFDSLIFLSKLLSFIPWGYNYKQI